MTTARYVALLRGVNVGGNRKLPMAALRALCESLGFSDVATYIQSGNVVLGSELAERKLVEALERAIAERFAISSAVMVRTHRQMLQVVEANPFPAADTGTLHVAFLPRPLPDDVAAALAAIDAPPEEFALRGREIYLHLPNGMGRAALPPALLDVKRLGMPTTVRNWRTVTTLTDMSA